MFRTTLKLNNEEQSAEGESLVETLHAVAKPFAYPKSKQIFKTSGVLTTEKDGKSAKSDLRLYALKRFLNNQTMREIWAKRIERIMK